MFSGHLDGYIRMTELGSGQELCRFLSLGEDWIVVSPEGYFDGTAGGIEKIRWSVGLRSYPLSAFSERHYAPGLLARLLSGEEIGTAGMAHLSEGFSLPPLVKIVSPKSGTRIGGETARIDVAISDLGGGIDEVRLYHNGKVVGVEKGGAAPSFTVPLMDGENFFRVVGLSRDRIEGNPDAITLIHEGAGKDSSLHVFAVGIDRYDNPALNLNYAEADARSITEFFAASGRKLFKEIHRHELYSGEATRSAILDGLRKLHNIPPQDVAVIFLAGHGDSAPDGWRFLPREVKYPERRSELEKLGISSMEIAEHLRRIGARKILVLIDACRSGQALEAFARRGYAERKALAQLARAAGVHVIAASTKAQGAAEAKDLGHGAFTYSLLAGLTGTADGSPKDGFVTVRELMAYVEARLPELGRRYQGEEQYPVADSSGMDFPISEITH